MTPSEEKINTQPAAQTGIGPTTLVAIEQNFPPAQRIIQDDLAVRILPTSYQILTKLLRLRLLRDWMIRATEKQLRGIWSSMVCRKRYIDEKVTSAVESQQVTALVNLGAGYDTRVYRLPALAHTPTWEVDQPVNIHTKQANLQKALGQIPPHVTLVPINFIEQDLATVLQAHGYTPNQKTFFIWEAVSQYLTESAVRHTFDFLAQAPTGSRLVFTYVLKSFIEGQELYGHHKFYEQMVVKEKAWFFGFDPDKVADFLATYGWHMTEHLGYDELVAQYVPPTGRTLPATPIERIVYAEKQ